MQTWRLIPARSPGRGAVIARHQGLKPYWGKPTVRHCRGGAGNVRDGRTRTPLHVSKEWRAETLGLRLHAPVPYSTRRLRPRGGKGRVVVLPHSVTISKPPCMTIITSGSPSSTRNECSLPVG